MPTPKISVQDADAYSDISNGSTISLASGSDGFSPRPPTGASGRRPQSAQTRKPKLGTSGSPYASKQTKNTRPQPMKPSNTSLWLAAMKSGTGALSTENTGINTWAGPRPAHATKKRGPGSRTRNFSEVVELANGKSKGHTRSASMSYTEPSVTSGAPAYKPPEDYYDEIIELKKIINTLKQENNTLSTKLLRTEQENVLKDRQIEDLLNSRKQPEDLRRTLTDKRGDTSSIVNSLKQKLHATERTVKEKESELSKLKRDMKLTDVDELSLQTEMYYQEVQRLQLALLEQQQARMHHQPAEGTMESRGGRGKTPMSASAQRTQDEVEFLKAENKSLKNDMIAFVEGQSKKDKKKPFKVEYADMSRGQLLQTIRDLEMKADDASSNRKARGSDDLSDDDPAKDKKQSKKVKGRSGSHGSTADLRSREAELLEEQEKQRQVIERLKEDRTHYRNVADELRDKLRLTEEELERYRSSSEKPQIIEQRRTSITSTASQYSTRKPSLRTSERESEMERELEEFKQRHAAKTLQKQWRQYHGHKQTLESERRWLKEQQEQDKAAQTLQKQWRRHRDYKRQQNEVEQEEAVLDIQAALRGHVVRQQRLAQMDEVPEEMDSDGAVVNIQSAMRGHVTRSSLSRQSYGEGSRNSPMDKRSTHELSESDDSDGGLDIEALSSRQDKSKSPFSSRKRSSFTDEIPSREPKPLPRTRASPSLHPPRPAPRTHRTPDSSPPLPPPRHTKTAATPTINLPDTSESDSDDDVVIGGNASHVRGNDLAAKRHGSVASSTDSSMKETASVSPLTEKSVISGSPSDSTVTRSETVAATCPTNSAIKETKIGTYSSPKIAVNKTTATVTPASSTNSDSDNAMVMFGSNKKITSSKSSTKKTGQDLKTDDTSSSARETRRQAGIQRNRQGDDELEDDFKRLSEARIGVIERNDLANEDKSLNVKATRRSKPIAAPRKRILRKTSSRNKIVHGATDRNSSKVHENVQVKIDGKTDDANTSSAHRDVQVKIDDKTDDANTSSAHGDVQVKIDGKTDDANTSSAHRDVQVKIDDKTDDANTSSAHGDVQVKIDGKTDDANTSSAHRDVQVKIDDKTDDANTSSAHRDVQVKIDDKTDDANTSSAHGDVQVKIDGNADDANTSSAHRDVQVKTIKGVADEKCFNACNEQQELSLSSPNKFFSGLEMPNFAPSTTKPIVSFMVEEKDDKRQASKTETNKNINIEWNNNNEKENVMDNELAIYPGLTTLNDRDRVMDPGNVSSGITSRTATTSDKLNNPPTVATGHRRRDSEHDLSSQNKSLTSTSKEIRKEFVGPERSTYPPSSLEEVFSSDGKDYMHQEVKKEGVARYSTETRDSYAAPTDSWRLSDNKCMPVRGGAGAGISKRVNPQRTIDEGSEESSPNLRFSSRDRKNTPDRHSSDRKSSYSDHKTTPTERKSSTSQQQNVPSGDSLRRKTSSRNRHEIADSDDDDDDDDVEVTSPKTAKNTGTSQRPSLSRNSASSHSREDRGKESSRTSSTRRTSSDKYAKTTGKFSREIDEDSEEDSDDVIVTSKRAVPVGRKDSSTSRSGVSKEPARRESFMDSLFSSSKSKSNQPNTKRRSMFEINDDVDSESDDDDDIVVTSKSNSRSKSGSSSGKRESKESLSSLWSSSTQDAKKHSDSGGLGFGFSSASRKRDITLDELF
ncbi:transcriptional regulator ATRX isoform X2 [Nematostella vectensis]|uniref:transcriptional regulator ATRX isoform X2 n=1 Tax=Nematostella vectensis TaxID=45351 RepID=UPI002076F43F|nr:transcriptional regulator ATRX isoform X2 [Nematostella vectensis]